MGHLCPEALGPPAHTAPCGVQEGPAFDPAGTWAVSGPPQPPPPDDYKEVDDASNGNYRQH